MKNIKSVKDVKKLVRDSGWKIFGIGGFSLTRSEMASLVDDFELIYSVESGEADSIKEKIKATHFDIVSNPLTRNPETIIADKKVQDYIKRNSEGKKIGIYVMKSSLGLERVCKKNGWIPICIPNKIFRRIDDRLFFLEILKEIRSDKKVYQIKVNEIEQKLPEFFNKIGKKLVIQIMEGAGGRGTFFVNKDDDLVKVVKEITERVNVLGGDQKGVVTITRFIKGEDFGVMGCVTSKNGILALAPRYQIIDIKESVGRKTDGVGVFCGHDWSFSNNFPEKAKEKVEEMVRQIGEIIFAEGYRGIFGVDFMIDFNDEIIPIEINPRLLGSFPVEVQVQLEQGEVPLLAFHLLEFLGVDYEIESKETYKKEHNREGAHLLLFNFFGRDVEFKQGIKGGVYKIEKGQLKYLRKGFEISDIKNLEEEFIITDGTPTKGFKKEKNKRICRIIYKKRILGENTKELSSEEKNNLEVVKNYLNKAV